MNCSIYSAFFRESDLLRSLSRECVLSAFFSGVLNVALLELPSCRSQNHSCGLLGLCPLSCQGWSAVSSVIFRMLVWCLFALWVLVLRASFNCLAECSEA